MVAMIRASGEIEDGLRHHPSAEITSSLEQCEARLADRERLVEEREMRLAERDRDLAETGALLQAREALLAAGLKNRRPSPPASPEEKIALLALKAELDRQEHLLMQGKETLRARELFLDESETRLFEKVQQHQEKETELEQREEELIAHEKALRIREAKLDPAVAAAMQMESAGKRFDEFNE